jgi:glycerophosphoryl diester phosphodiesterase
MVLFWILAAAALAVGAAALYFYFTRGEPAENWLSDFAYAHRGLHGGDAPENSMRAFELAAQKGFGIELDVHLSRDGIPVVIHDDNLKRMTGIDKAAAELDAGELSALSLAGSAEGIPVFADVLRRVAGRVPLLVEIKNRGRAGELEEKVWDLLKAYKGLYAVQSFSPYSMGWFRNRAPNVLRGQLSSRFKDMEESLPAYQIFGLTHLLTNFLARPNFISYEIGSLPRGVVVRLRKKGITVLGWTVRSAEQKIRAEKYCDAVIFENIIP